MVEAVNTKDLANAIEATKKSWRRDSNNLALSGQIQFSSIMRTFVDTPEKMMELATAQTKAKQQPDDRPAATAQDDFRASVREKRESAGRDVGNSDRPVERAPQRAKLAEKTKSDAPPKKTDDSNPQSDTSTDTPVASADKPQATAGKSMRDEMVQEAQPTVQTPANIPATDPTQTPNHLVVLTQATHELSHGAQSSMSAALIDRHFTRVGEDIHDAAQTTLTETVNTHIGPQAALNSLKDEQASDLANRLGGMGQFAISVDAGTNSAKTSQAPLHGLGANVNFGQFDGLNANDSSQPDTPFQSGGDGSANTQKAPSTHANVQMDRAAASSPQDIANVLGQAMRTQAAMTGQTGTQPGAETKIMAPTETVQAIGAAAPTGAAQSSSQAAKAAPATPARQPEKPQSPAEQIAVKIRQAVGEGADKINIKLNPHELGRVEVRLEMSKDGGIVATVLADRQETLDMLQKDARGLERALNDAGLRTDAASLTYGLRGDGQKDLANGRERSGRNGSNTRNPDREALSRIEFGETTGLARSNAYRRPLGANDGVDIRV
jgi:flagellar hook-length control protein FliK